MKAFVSHEGHHKFISGSRAAYFYKRDTEIKSARPKSKNYDYSDQYFLLGWLISDTNLTYKAGKSGYELLSCSCEKASS